MKKTAYTYAQIQHVKLRVLRGLKIAAFIACGLLFWKAFGAFMWICYYAGVPM